MPDIFRKLLEMFLGRKKPEAFYPAYQIVEAKFQDEDDMFRQGIKILEGPYRDIILTIHPQVKLQEEDGQLRLRFDYTIEKIPDETIDTSGIRQTIGDIIMDMMYKDYVE